MLCIYETMGFLDFTLFKIKVCVIKKYGQTIFEYESLFYKNISLKIVFSPFAVNIFLLFSINKKQ